MGKKINKYGPPFIDLYRTKAVAVAEVHLKAAAMKSASPTSTLSSLQVDVELGKKERFRFLDLKPDLCF